MTYLVVTTQQNSTYNTLLIPHTYTTVSEGNRWYVHIHSPQTIITRVHVHALRHISNSFAHVNVHVPVDTNVDQDMYIHVYLHTLILNMKTCKSLHSFRASWHMYIHVYTCTCHTLANICQEFIQDFEFGGETPKFAYNMYMEVFQRCMHMCIKTLVIDRLRIVPSAYQVHTWGSLKVAFTRDCRVDSIPRAVIAL